MCISDCVKELGSNTLEKNFEFVKVIQVISEAALISLNKEIVDVLQSKNAAQQTAAAKLQDAAPTLADACAACTWRQAPPFDRSFQEAREEDP